MILATYGYSKLATFLIMILKYNLAHKKAFPKFIGNAF